MSRHRPLPRLLAAAPFTTAKGREQGLTPNQLRAGWLHAPHRGVRAAAELVGPRGRARMLLPVMPPGAAFWATTAAELCDLPLPLRREDDGVVHVAVPPGTTPLRRPGVRCVTRTLAGRTITRKGVFPVVHPRWLWLEALPGSDLDDHVALADAVMTRWSSRAQMTQALDAVRGQRGTARAAAVLDLAREPVKSAMETRTCLLVVRAGIPEPELNRSLLTDGEWVAEVDFLWRAARLCGDYDGDDHRSDRARWQADNDRHDLIERHGYQHVRWTSRSVLERPERTVQLLAGDLRARGLRW